MLRASEMAYDSVMKPASTRRSRTRRTWLHLFTLALFVAGSPLSSPAEPKPQDVVEQLYGEALTSARKSNSPDDDLALARQMLDAAKMTMQMQQPSKELAVELSLAAYELVWRLDDGLDTAIEAMQIRQDAEPATATDAAQRLIAAYQIRFGQSRGTERVEIGERMIEQWLHIARTAESSHDTMTASNALQRALSIANLIEASSWTQSQIKQQLRGIREQAQINRRLEQLEARFDANPQTPGVADDLVMLYLIERDDPAQALKYAEHASEPLAPMAQNANKPTDQLEPQALLQLADWYAGQADKIRSNAKATVQTRALNYYNAYLEHDQGNAMTRIRVRIAVDQLAQDQQQTDDPRPAVTTTRWPGVPAGLVFAFQDAKTSRNLKLTRRGDVAFSDQGAMELRGGAILAEAYATRLLKACQKTNELTVEAVIRPFDLHQGGPARIISFSSDSVSRNFSVMQEHDQLVLRLRTPQTGDNGNNPQLTLAKIDNTNPVHLLVTASPQGVQAYLNGEQTLDTAQVKADFSNWTPQMLLFGNEHEDERPWRGQLQRITISGKAVDAETAKQHFNAVQRFLELEED